MANRSQKTIDITQPEPPSQFLTHHDEPDPSWGRLLPMALPLQKLDLEEKQNKYTFGRDPNCDVELSERTLVFDKAIILALSKRHFEISRVETPSGVVAELTDLSSNGTFINGLLIGKGKREVLKSGDVIAVNRRQKYSVFTFVDPAAQAAEMSHFPADINDRYVVLKTLGSGAHGEVRMVCARGSGVSRRYALKIIDTKRLTTMVLKSADTEEKIATLLQNLDHPNVIRIEDVIRTDRALYVVLELAEGGELFNELLEIQQKDPSKKVLSEFQAKLIFFQLLCGVKYLHDKSIIHRDLKAENVLLMSKGSMESLVKITDFGLSKVIDEGSFLKSLVGTPLYVAPEIILSKGQYDEKVDCWSLGVLLYVLLVSYPPFNADDSNLNDQILSGKIAFHSPYWDDISSEAKDLVKRLILVDPRRRFSAAQALKHAWFQDEDMLKRAWELMYPECEFPGAGVWDPAVHPPPQNAQLETQLASSNGDPSTPAKPHSPSASDSPPKSSASSHAMTRDSNKQMNRSPHLLNATIASSAPSTPGSPHTGTSQLLERLHLAATPENCKNKRAKRRGQIANVDEEMACESTSSPHKVPNGATKNQRALRSARRREHSPSDSSEDSQPAATVGVGKSGRQRVEDAAGDWEQIDPTNSSPNGAAASSAARQLGATVPKRGRPSPSPHNKES